MNYYERHLGDYARDTGHLSMVEHGAYTLLLDRYYASEQGIPADQAHRLARARTRDEKAAVDAVLEEFFVLTDGVWKHRKVEQEIEKAASRIEAARSNGKRGGRPRKNPVGSEEKPSGFPLGSVDKPSKKLTTHQTPCTNHQLSSDTSHTLEGSEGSDADGVCGTPAGAAAVAMNRAGCRVTSYDPNLLAACAEGVTPENLAEVIRLYPGKPAGYVIAAARRIRADQAAGTGETHANPRRLSAAEQTRAAIRERRAREDSHAADH